MVLPSLFLDLGYTYGFVMSLVLCAANVDFLIISDVENITSFLDAYISRSEPSLKSSLVYVENRPGRLRCVAVGGQPPPSVTVQLLPPVASGLPVRRLELAESWWVTVGGRRGLRVVRRVTEQGTSTFMATTHDDGAEVRCSAVVNGLPPRSTTAKVIVHCSLSLTVFNNNNNNNNNNNRSYCQRNMLSCKQGSSEQDCKVWRAVCLSHVFLPVAVETHAPGTSPP